MGYMQASEMRRFLAEDQALRWHLTSNHYPPIHEAFLPSVKTTLEHARAEEWDEQIELPNGKVLSVRDVVEQLHLQAFLEPGDDDEREVCRVQEGNQR